MKQNSPLKTTDGRETEIFHHQFNKYSFYKKKILNSPNI